MDIVYIHKCRYEIQEQKKVMLWYMVHGMLGAFIGQVH
jgi:hypothetical protein